MVAMPPPGTYLKMFPSGPVKMTDSEEELERSPFLIGRTFKTAGFKKKLGHLCRCVGEGGTPSARRLHVWPA